LKNGLLPVAIDEAVHAKLVAERARHPQLTLSIDLPLQRLTLPTGEHVPFAIDVFAKKCLEHGLDELGYLLTFEPQIRAHEARHESKQP